jgi:hypothetical protein
MASPIANHRKTRETAMKKKLTALASSAVQRTLTRMTVASIVVLAAAGSAGAAQGPVPTGIPRLDHVFVIMMENHAYGQIAGNAQAPFTNALMAKANLATNYFAIAHPSSTNYLEVVGGSNFNDLSDQYPNWHSASCTPNIVPRADDQYRRTKHRYRLPDQGHARHRCRDTGVRFEHERDFEPTADQHQWRARDPR